jgi:hypothetical protein
MFLSTCDDPVTLDTASGTLAEESFNVTYTANPVLLESREGIFYFEISGEGVDDNYGKTTFESILTVMEDSDPPWEQSGEMVFIDYEGNRLMGSYNGIANPQVGLEALIEIPIRGTGEFTISHGTGKFQNYMGFGTYTFTLTKDQKGIFEFSGRLTSHF